MMKANRPLAEADATLSQAAGKSPGALGAMSDILDRLERLIDAETDALRRFKAIDLREFNNRKSQVLLELMRAARTLAGAPAGTQLSMRLKTVRDKLAANQAALATHLKAARAITTILADAIRDSESDGTYSNTAVFGAASPW